MEVSAHRSEILYTVLLTPQIICKLLEIYVESNLDVYIENCGTVENYIIFEYISPTGLGKSSVHQCLLQCTLQALSTLPVGSS